MGLGSNPSTGSQWEASSVIPMQWIWTQNQDVVWCISPTLPLLSRNVSIKFCTSTMPDDYMLCLDYSDLDEDKMNLCCIKGCHSII